MEETSWIQEYDETSGCFYYINASTQETTWDEPPDFSASYDGGGESIYTENSSIGGDTFYGGKSEYDFEDELRNGGGGSSVLDENISNKFSGSMSMTQSDTLSAIPENMSTTLAGSSALSAPSAVVGLTSIKGINPKGRRMGEFPTEWKLPKMGLGNDTVLDKAALSIFGDSRMTLLRINQWTADKPQRYFFSTEDTPPEKGWDYCYSFFGYSHPTKDTHLFQIQHKREPCLRSKLVRTLMVDRNRELEQELLKDHKKVVGGYKNRTLEFFARYNPQNGLVKINIQDMQAPDRHKITYKPPVGYWFQKYPLYAFACTLWNVQEYPEPHNFRIVPQGQSSTADPGWEQW